MLVVQKNCIRLKSLFDIPLQSSLWGLFCGTPLDAIFWLPCVANLPGFSYMPNCITSYISINLASNMNKFWIWTPREKSLIIWTNNEWVIIITLGWYLYWTLLEQRLMSCPVSRQNLTWMRTKLAPFLKDWTGYAQTLNNIWMGTELEQTPNIPGTEFEFPFRLCSGPTLATSTKKSIISRTKPFLKI